MGPHWTAWHVIGMDHTPVPSLDLLEQDGKAVFGVPQDLHSLSWRRLSFVLIETPQEYECVRRLKHTPGIESGRNGCMTREHTMQRSSGQKERCRCVSQVHSHGSAFCSGSIADVRLCTTFSTPCVLPNVSAGHLWPCSRFECEYSATAGRQSINLDSTCVHQRT